MVGPALNRGSYLLQRDFAINVRLHQSPQPALISDPLTPFQAPPVRKDDEAQERDAFRNGSRVGARVDGQSQVSQAVHQRVAPRPQRCLVVGEEQGVVHVAQIAFAAQFPLDEVVKGVQITIGPKLAGQIAYRQPPRPVYGEQIIAGEPDHVVRLAEHAHTTLQNAIDQPHHIRIVDFAAQNFAQDGMIHRREKLPHVALEHVAIAAGKRLAAVQGAMRPLADPVGIAVTDETPLKDGLDQAA